MTGESCSKRDVENLRIIIGFCRDIELLTEIHGRSEKDFRENISLQYGCVFSLEQIGEHVKRLSSGLKDKYSETDWKGVAGLRDRIVHSYGSIDLSWIRSSVMEEVPILEAVCETILKDIETL